MTFSKILFGVQILHNYWGEVLVKSRPPHYWSSVLLYFVSEGFQTGAGTSRASAGPNTVTPGLELTRV
jgi:hypothetical protein